MPSVHEAAATGDLEELTKLVNQDASLRNARDDRSKTAMHWVSAHRHRSMARGRLRWAPDECAPSRAERGGAGRRASSRGVCRRPFG